MKLNTNQTYSQTSNIVTFGTKTTTLQCILEFESTRFSVIIIFRFDKIAYCTRTHLIHKNIRRTTFNLAELGNIVGTFASMFDLC